MVVVEVVVEEERVGVVMVVVAVVVVWRARDHITNAGGRGMAIVIVICRCSGRVVSEVVDHICS